MSSFFRAISLVGIVVLSATGNAVADEVVASAADTGKTVSVHLGQVLTVNLTGTHGSGKYWRLNADLTPELTLSGRTTSQAVTLLGAPETTSYSFKTNVPGTLVFKASYIAPGAPVPKTKDVEFTIQVLNPPIL